MQESHYGTTDYAGLFQPQSACLWLTTRQEP